MLVRRETGFMSEVQNYHAPDTLDEALKVLDGNDVTVLAGGTDLMIQSRSGKTALGDTLLNVQRVAELRGINIADGAVRIGAGTTITDILDSAMLAKHAPVLVSAADQFASDQIRNAATIGGNISNASPAGDTLPPLLVLDARIELVAMPNGTRIVRHVPLAEFIAAPGQTVRRPQELISAVVFPVPAAGFRSGFYKFGVRPALDISTISIAAGMLVEDEYLRDVRLAFGAVSAKPFRATGIESALKDGKVSAATFDNAATMAADAVSPIDDIRATAWYRRELIRNMTRRILNDAWQS